MPHPTQRGWAFSIGKAAHYVLLVVLVSMLITGPMSVWFNGEPIRVFGVHIVSPFAARLSVADFAHRAHVFGANIIIVVTLLHIGGVIKHTAINGDRTLDRMLIPGNRLRDSE